MEEKKGIQLSQAFGAVLTLVLVAVLVIIAIVIFVTLATSFEGTSDAITVTNESGAWLNQTSYTLNAAGNCSFGDLSLAGITDTSTATTLPAANFTLTDAGVLTNATTVTNALVNLTYSYTWGSEACDASENMTSEFGNYTSLIGLVGTIIFLGLVIGILVAAFAFGGRRV